MTCELPPFSYSSSNGTSSGFAVELVRLMEERIGGEESNILFYPWPRAYRKMQTGSGDVLFPMAITPERATKFKFVGPIYWDEIYFYSRKGSNIKLTCTGDARKVRRIGVTKNGFIHVSLQKMGFTNLEPGPSRKCDFLKLVRGRVDLVPMGEKAISQFMHLNSDLNPADYERVGPPVTFVSIYIAFATTVPDGVVARWQAAFDSLKQDGTWLKLKDKYFPQEAVE
ncbi:transporter substrate-binding domain-containing protein [Maridesulfovibrio sp.]|uniref:substrate-binding periplasmic protein n=1 Tax=Maridesulfovibrio sp. TaxID=2795000 RepID=UPI002A18BCA0|nr:transporter substrate-binding domain-containing protein [Maridesulfovibrio sp.]